MADDLRTFGTAFRDAKAAGLQEFEWRGKRFSTQTAGEAKTPQYQPQLMPQNPVNMNMAPSQGLPFPPMAQGSPGTGVDVMAPPAQTTAAAPNGFDMAGGVTDTSWMAEPPKTPEERASRVNSWQNFFSRIQQDPNLLMAIMKMGTQLMQPIAPGQSVGGHFGNALAGSVDYLQALNAAQQKTVMEQAKVAADVEQSKAATEASRANVQLAQRGDARAEKQLTKQLQLIDKQLTTAQTQGDLAQVQLKVAKFKSNPAFMQAEQDKTMKELDARLAAEQARITAYQASLENAKEQGKAAAAIELKLQAEKDASIAYVESVDQAIRDLADQLSKTKKREIPFEIAREEFLADKPQLADHYWKYVGLASQERVKKVGGKDGKDAKTPPPAVDPKTESADAALKRQKPGQLRDRTSGQSDFTIIKQPDGTFKTVPTHKIPTQPKADGLPMFEQPTF